MSWQRRHSVHQREALILVGESKQGFTEEMPFAWTQERWIGRKIGRKEHSMRGKEYEKRHGDGNLFKE